MKLESLNDVIELFGKIGGIGNENCIFFAQKEEAHIGEPGTVSKAVVGGVVNRLTGGAGRLVEEMMDIAMDSSESTELMSGELNLDSLNNYMQFLINETENTIAIIPIHCEGVLHLKTDKVQVFLESGVVINKSIIDKIEIKKFSFLTPTVRGVKFKLINGYKLEFIVTTNLKTLPYHINNFKRFNAKYKK